MGLNAPTEKLAVIGVGQARLLPNIAPLAARAMDHVVGLAARDCRAPVRAAAPPAPRKNCGDEYSLPFGRCGLSQMHDSHCPCLCAFQSPKKLTKHNECKHRRRLLHTTCKCSTICGNLRFHIYKSQTLANARQPVHRTAHLQFQHHTKKTGGFPRPGAASFTSSPKIL